MQANESTIGVTSTRFASVPVFAIFFNFSATKDINLFLYGSIIVATITNVRWTSKWHSVDIQSQKKKKKKSKTKPNKTHLI